MRKELTKSGWVANWYNEVPNVIYIDYEGKAHIRSQGVIRYEAGSYGYDWPEIVPDSVRKKLENLFEKLHTHAEETILSAVKYKCDKAYYGPHDGEGSWPEFLKNA